MLLTRHYVIVIPLKKNVLQVVFTKMADALHVMLVHIVTKAGKQGVKNVIIQPRAFGIGRTNLLVMNQTSVHGLQHAHITNTGIYLELLTAVILVVHNVAPIIIPN